MGAALSIQVDTVTVLCHHCASRPVCTDAVFKNSALEKGRGRGTMCHGVAFTSFISDVRVLFSCHSSEMLCCLGFKRHALHNDQLMPMSVQKTELMSCSSLKDTMPQLASEISHLRRFYPEQHDVQTAVAAQFVKQQTPSHPQKAESFSLPYRAASPELLLSFMCCSSTAHQRYPSCSHVPHDTPRAAAPRAAAALRPLQCLSECAAGKHMCNQCAAAVLCQDRQSSRRQTASVTGCAAAAISQACAAVISRVPQAAGGGKVLSKACMHPTSSSSTSYRSSKNSCWTS